MQFSSQHETVVKKFEGKFKELTTSITPHNSIWLIIFFYRKNLENRIDCLQQIQMTCNRKVSKLTTEIYSGIILHKTRNRMPNVPAENSNAIPFSWWLLIETNNFVSNSAMKERNITKKWYLCYNLSMLQLMLLIKNLFQVTGHTRRQYSLLVECDRCLKWAIWNPEIFTVICEISARLCRGNFILSLHCRFIAGDIHFC